MKGFLVAWLFMFIFFMGNVLAGEVDVEIVSPLNGSTLNSFIVLEVVTDVDAVCNYNLGSGMSFYSICGDGEGCSGGGGGGGASSPREMRYTGGVNHSQSIGWLEDTVNNENRTEWYWVSVSCDDGTGGNGSVKSVFYVEREYLESFRVIRDYGVDDDGNGLYDWLVVEFELNVSEAGEYEIRTGLRDDYSYVRSFINENLEAGVQNVSFYFDGNEIYGNNGTFSFRVDPLQIKKVDVFEHYDIDPSYVISNYSSEQFERYNTQQFLILEDIGKYDLVDFDRNDSSEQRFRESEMEYFERYSVEDVHFAYYSNGEEFRGVSVFVMKFNSSEGAMTSLKDGFEKCGDCVLDWNGSNVYYNYKGEVFTLWYSGEYVVWIDNAPMAWDIMEGYLEKFPSNLSEVGYKLEDYLILEDVGNYSFVDIDRDDVNERWWSEAALNYSSGEAHFGYYENGQNDVIAMVGRSDSYLLDVFSIANVFDKVRRGNYYLYNVSSLGNGLIFWISGDYVVGFHEEEDSWEVVDAYLEKFPSDMVVKVERKRSSGGGGSRKVVELPLINLSVGANDSVAVSGDAVSQGNGSSEFDERGGEMIVSDLASYEEEGFFSVMTGAVSGVGNGVNYFGDLLIRVFSWFRGLFG